MIARQEGCPWKMIVSSSERLMLTRASISAGADACRGFRRPSPGIHTPGPMAILKVEPLTTARALRGPFDYRRPEAMEGLEGGSLVRVAVGPPRPFGGG